MTLNKTLRKGKAKTILESSIESALLAVEIYNKPRIPFRVENYISLMVMAWTKLLHTYFYQKNGDTFYHKKRNSPRYELVDGERKSWELKTCIKKCKYLEEPIKANIDFFIKLRNKIEHRHITKENVGNEIFGECQSLLYNYETTLVKFFGEDYAINESLAFSLQFSKLRTIEQEKSSKKLLSRDVQEIRDFIQKYRSSLKDEIFNSQEYSVKLIQIPKISNNSKKNVPAIEFVNLSNLSEEDKQAYDKLTVLIKDKVVKTEVINPGKLKPTEILNKVKEKTNNKFTHHDHKCLYYLFSIRPTPDDQVSAFKTNTKYCHYDEVHDDYVYQDAWADFISKIIQENKIKKDEWSKKFKLKEKLNIEDFE